MKSIIPYTKSISFGSKIAEITSMSLEHEMDIKPGEISGNFIISGEYKSHEVSVNREPFLHKLPFTIELTENIDLESIEFEITDFSYDILNDDTIEVSIEFSLDALEMSMEETESLEKSEHLEEREILEQFDEESAPVEIIDLIDTPLVKNEMGAKDGEMEQIETREMLELEEVEEREDVMIKEQKEKVVQVEDMKESEETIIKNVNPMDDSYATYHIHIVKEGENIETICTMYHSNLNLLSEYNSMENMNVGDKIIIPSLNA